MAKKANPLSVDEPVVADWSRKPESPVDSLRKAVDIAMGRTGYASLGVDGEEPQAPQVVESTAIVEVPLGVVSGSGYVSRRADVKLSRDQCLTLRALLRGLQDRGEQLQNGRPVTNCTSAVQWMLEKIASSADKPFVGSI